MYKIIKLRNTADNKSEVINKRLFREKNFHHDFKLWAEENLAILLELCVSISYPTLSMDSMIHIPRKIVSIYKKSVKSWKTNETTWVE